VAARLRARISSGFGAFGERVRRADRAHAALFFGVLVLMVAIRVWYFFYARKELTLDGDYMYFNLFALEMSTFQLPHGAGGAPSAGYPPGFPLFLAIFDRLGFGTPRDQSFECMILTCITPLFVYGMARRIGGKQVGLLALLLAAADPGIWLYAGRPWSEAWGQVLAAASLALALRIREKGGWASVGLFGFALSWLGLTRPETLLYIPFLGVPAIWMGGRSLRRRLGLLVMFGIFASSLILPWSIRNLLVFRRFDPITTYFGEGLVNGNCDQAYYGPEMGSYDLACVVMRFPKGFDESQIDYYKRAKALSYIRKHLDRVPAVLAARLLREYGLFRPFEQANLDARDHWSYPVALARLGSVWILDIGLVFGVLALRQRRAELYLLLVPVVVASIAVVIVLAEPRYRASMEPALLVLTAVGAPRAVAVGRRVLARVRRADTRRVSLRAAMRGESTASGLSDLTMKRAMALGEAWARSGLGARQPLRLGTTDVRLLVSLGRAQMSRQPRPWWDSSATAEGGQCTEEELAIASPRRVVARVPYRAWILADSVTGLEIGVPRYSESPGEPSAGATDGDGFNAGEADPLGEVVRAGLPQRLVFERESAVSNLPPVALVGACALAIHAAGMADPVMSG
jgi:hypothetical protein